MDLPPPERADEERSYARMALRRPLDAPLLTLPAPVPGDRGRAGAAPRPPLPRLSSESSPRFPLPRAGGHRSTPADAGADGSVWAVVERAQQGDAEAFGELYDRYVGLVSRYVHARLDDRSLAEDVTSETFVRALRRIDSLSFQGRDLGAWLVTIAGNLIRDHVKSSRYRLEVTTADMLDADRATAGPEDAVVQQLADEQLRACVQQLRGDQRECIALRFLHGLSVAETAAAMGRNEGAVKALQHRAVRRLAGLLPDGLR